MLKHKFWVKYEKITLICNKDEFLINTLNASHTNCVTFNAFVNSTISCISYQNISVWEHNLHSSWP